MASLAAGPAAKAWARLSSSRMAGPGVDDHGLDLPAAPHVDEDHAAFVRLEPGIAPRCQGDDHRAQGAPELGQYVLVADRVSAGLAAA